MFLTKQGNKQQALNQLDDYIPQAPPGSPPYSPSSPEYSPVYCSPIMEYPDYASDSTSGTDTTIFDEDDDEPLIEKHHTSWGLGRA